jgi:hypothetical protein
MGVAASDVQSFEIRHGISAYLCRWSGCVSAGFRTDAERTRHETSHTRQFRCPDPSCGFAINGFASRHALRKHMLKYHTGVEELILPDFPIQTPKSGGPLPSSNMAEDRETIGMTAAGGKTTEGQTEDLRLYDILQRKRISNPLFDNLRDTPPLHLRCQPHPEVVDYDVCMHRYCTKVAQSLLPRVGCPALDSCYKIASICQDCRTHLELEVDHGQTWQNGSSANQGHHIHDLVFSSNDRNSIEMNTVWNEKYKFLCSSVTCAATAYVRLRVPVLNMEWVRLLTDSHLMTERAIEMIRTTPRLAGYPIPQPGDVLGDLLKYIQNCWVHPARLILDRNKRFMTRFGEGGIAFRDMLQRLGFTKTVSGAAIADAIEMLIHT